jgi:hypothetical protein
MEGSGDSWYVQLSDGDVHRVTLDQLDEAFQLGHIGASTMVLAPDGPRWTKLGCLASIDDEAAEPLSSQRPVSMDLIELELPPPRRARRWIVALVAVAVLTGAGAAATRRPSWAKAYWTRVQVLATRGSSRLAAMIPIRPGDRHGAPAATSLPPAAAIPTPAAAAMTTLSTTPAANPLANPVAAPTATTSPVAVAALAKPASADARKQTAVGNRPARHKAKARRTSEPSVPPAIRSSKPPSSGFSTGGSKFDPLNSSI